MSEWQPIETAPKDGAWIIVYGPHDYGDVRIARWESRPQYTWVNDGPDTQRRVPSGEQSRWFTHQLGWDDMRELADRDDENFSIFREYEPTHWLPLPKPPNPA